MAVVASIFGHVGGEERAAASGVPGVFGASVAATPRLRVGGPTCWRRAVRGDLVWDEAARAKAQRFGADGGDTCGRRYPLGGVVVVTFPMFGLRVKTLVLWSRRRGRTTSLPSWGRRRGVRVLLPLGLVSVASATVGKSESCFEELSAMAWSALGDLLSSTRDSVFTFLHPRCPLAGSALHGPEREGRRPFPVTIWWRWCD